MKRYRILSFDIDSRPALLNVEIQDLWEEQVKQLHRENQERMRQELVAAYGSEWIDIKIQNLIELGSAPVSIIAYHNKFLHQTRSAFTIGAYYPALLSACALGERILNHLLLRDDFSYTPEYQKVRDKKSFSNWTLAIDTLETWGVLLPTTVGEFRKLEKARHRAVHFNPETDNNDRPLALEAIRLLQEIVNQQFCAFGLRPWFITDVLGECYIKKNAEQIPFIQKIYLSQCCLVGPYHALDFDKSRFAFIVHDDYQYDDREISDEEFVDLRNANKNS